MAELSARERKLVQYLNEAYGKEKELETSLQAHIGMTSRGDYKKRLQQHLAETKRHARELERRIKKVGGTPEAGPLEGFEPFARGASVAVGIGNRAVAAVQGPIHALRGTGEQERMLKNAMRQYANEHEEIAMYTAIEALAKTLSDSETARLAHSIRREEEGMANFLERLIPTLTKAVMQDDVPSAQRGSRGSAKASRRNGASPSRNGAAKRGSSTSRRGSSARSTSSRTASSRGPTKAASKATRSASKATAKASRARSKATAKASRATTKARRAGSTPSSRARRRTVASGGRRLGVPIGA